MLLVLRIILGVSFLALALLVAREKLLRQKGHIIIAKDASLLFRSVFRLRVLGKRKESSHISKKESADVKPKSFHREYRRVLAESGISSVFTKLFDIVAKAVKIALHFLFVVLAPLPGRFARGVVLFGKDLLRLSRLVFVFASDRFKRTFSIVKQDLQTFSLPSHKQDFFDRLQDRDSQPVGKKEISEEAKTPSARPQRPLSSPVPDSVIPDSSESPVAPRFSRIEIHKEESQAAPGFHVRKVSSLHQPNKEPQIDLGILQEKEHLLLERIVQDPKNPSSYKRLGKVYLQMKKKVDARQCFEYALKLGARDPEVRALLSQMEHAGMMVRTR